MARWSGSRVGRDTPCAKRRVPHFFSILAMSGTALLVLPSPLVSAREPGPVPAQCRPQASVMDLPRGSGKEWFGLYVLDRKAGWLESSVSVERRAGKKVLVARQAMVIEVTVGQRTVRREQTETKVYEGRPGGHLLAYSSVRKGDGGDRSLNVECGGPTCKVATTAEDGTRNTEIPLPSERTEQADAARLAAARCGTVRGVQLAPEDLRS